jgi:acetylornithine deacetylase/succinyl-diaminopimelate desuccinylase-like protein
MSIGLVPPVASATLRSEIELALESVIAGWDVEGASFLYDILDESEAIELPDGLPIIACVSSALGSEVPLSGFASWTDAGNLLVHHGLACMVIGAGDLHAAHSNHEWVEIADLVRLSELLVAILRSPPS